MLFNSIDFMFFFPVVVLIYYIVPRKLKSLWLLLSSYYFYMGWNPKYALLIGTSTIITYVSGIIIDQIRRRCGKQPKAVLIAVMIACIGSNLGILGIFKYANFSIDSINKLLEVLNLAPIEYRFNFLLPVGISFYTFQALV